MSGVGSSTISGTPVGLLDLAGRPGRPGRKSATAAAITTTSAAGGRGPARPAPSRPRSRPGPPRRRPATGRSTVVTRVTLAPRGAGLLGEGVALLARGAVGDEAHRVDRLAGAAGGDQHVQPGRGPARSSTPLDRGHDVARDRPGGPRRCRRRPGGPPRAATTCTPRLAQRGRGCPAPRGAPTSRCAWPGQTTTGARVASRVAVSRSSRCRRRRRRAGGRWPGHTTTRSAVWPEAGVRDRVGARRTARCCTGSEASAENVVAPTKRVAPSVSTGHDVGAGVDEATADLDRLVGGDAAGDAEDDPPAGQQRARGRARRRARPASARRGGLGRRDLLGATGRRRRRSCRPRSPRRRSTAACGPPR